LTGSLVSSRRFFAIVITVPLASFAAMPPGPGRRPRRKAVLADGPRDALVLVRHHPDRLVLGRPALVPGRRLRHEFLAHLHSLLLPGLCAAIGIVPVLIRSLRSACSRCSGPTTSRPPARKGLRPSRVTFVHVARNALIPTVTLLGINIAYLIGGTVVIERVFALNGLGSAMLTAIDNRDFPVVQGVTTRLRARRDRRDLDNRSRHGAARPEDKAQVSAR